VALALALVGRPALAVLDEPTAGLDVEGRGRVRDVLGEVRASGAAILLTSHDLGDVERVADRIAILAGGRIVAEGRPDELAAGGGHVLRFRLAAPLDDADRADLANRLGSAIVADDVGAAAYRVPGIAATAEVIARLAAWCGTRDTLIVELRTGGGTLEERYLELTGGGGDEKDEPAS
jgi:ABC-2 type transport system ATP-binding protein